MLIRSPSWRVASRKMLSDSPGWSQEENSSPSLAFGLRSSSSALGITLFHGRGQLAGKTLCTPERLRIATALFGRGGRGIPAAVLGSGQGLSPKVLHPASKSFMSPRLA